MILFGLRTCDTCRKAAAALRAAGREVAFRDLRADPLSEAERAEFVSALGDRLVNRSSATWRGLSEAERALPADQLIALHPAVMKRPVIRSAEGALSVGWDAAVQAALTGPAS